MKNHFTKIAICDTIIFIKVNKYKRLLGESMKRIKLISTLTACVLCLSILVIGVWAVASTALFNVNGNLKFYPEGVFVKLSGQVYKGITSTDFEAITSNPRFTYGPVRNFDESPDLASGNFPIDTWDIGDLIFIPTEKYIKISVEITNYSSFPIKATPNITIDNQEVSQNQEFNVVYEEEIQIALSLQTITYEIILESIADTEINKSFNVAFEFEEYVPNPNYSNFNIVDNEIKSLNSDYVEDLPGLLVVPGYAEGTNTPLAINVTYPETNPFSNLRESTKNIIIVEGLTSICDYAFQDCSNLVSIKLPNSLKSIGSRAFDSCTSLKSINIPSGTANIGTSGIAAFSNCYNLEKVSLDEDNEYFYCEGNCIIEKSTEKLVIGCNTSIIPEGVKVIEGYVFEGYINLKSITIPEGVTTLNNAVFNLCSNLTKVILPSTLTTIGSGVFNNCSNLTNITISAVVPPSVGSYSFSGINSLSVYVPAESIDAYKSAWGLSSVYAM